ncbi:DUF3631 domain-containing protein [Streptomyces sp. NBC_00433]
MAITQMPDAAVEAVTDAPPMPAQSPYAGPDYAPGKTAPTRTGGAAMVVARATGRGLGGGARWVVNGVVHSGRQWVDLYHDDYPHMIGLAKEELKAAKGTPSAAEAKATVKQWRRDHKRHRLQHLGRTSIGTLTTGGTLAVGGLVIGGWLDLLLAGFGIGAAAWHGQRGTGATAIEAAPEREAIEPGAVLDNDGPPFPLSQAHDAEQVRVCVWRALKTEGVPVAEVYDIVRQQWGWQCVVRVSEGTPETIISKAGALETRFDLPTNGVRTQPMVERRACAVVRLVSGDPFASAPSLPYRAPLSLSILDKARYGTSVGGDPLDMSFAGVMGLVVAASGGGKTGILQAIGEITTACRDNITIDIDPHGDGLEDLHDAVRLTARTTEQIEAVLLFLLMLSKGRARLRKKLGMGRKWQVSPERPHFTVPFDEFPKASKLAKKLAFELLLVGRKEAVTEILAAQGGTTLYLGENIAQMIAFKAVGPCKVGDTRAVFGDGAVSEGWLPHKLSPATDTDPKDAGHLFVQGVPGRADEPIEYKVHEIPSATLRKLATERREAGLVEPDQESLDAMREVDLPDYVLPEYDAEGNLKKEAPVQLLTWDQLLRLCDAEPAFDAAPGLARTVLADAVDLMDKFGVDRMRTETLTAALVDHDPGVYGEMTADELKAYLAEAGVGKPVTLGQIDGMSNPRGFKRDQLAAAM